MPDLTFMERRVLLLMMNELGSKEIAEHLGIERSTVKTHRKNLYRKTGTHDPVSLVGWGRRYLRAEFIEIDRLLHPEDEDGSRNLPRSG